jgi:hypothetical protein
MNRTSFNAVTDSACDDRRAGRGELMADAVKHMMIDWQKMVEELADKDPAFAEVLIETGRCFPGKMSPEDARQYGLKMTQLVKAYLEQKDQCNINATKLKIS